MAKVGIVIPCYNQGEYVMEAINSVLNSNYDDYEIIVVNDGSTDEQTNEILNEIEIEKCRLITNPNKGVSNARNTAIKQLDCEYILPLDADDKVHPDYIPKAIEFFDQNPEYDLVYCHTAAFGAQEGLWELDEYSKYNMIISNCIFVSAFYRKEMWEKIGGYDESMKRGLEDYNFWLYFVEMDAKVKRLNDIYFYYRVKPASATTRLIDSHLNSTYEKLIDNHKKLFSDNINVLYQERLKSKLQSYLYLDYGEGFSSNYVIFKRGINLGQSNKITFDIEDNFSYCRIKQFRFDPVKDLFFKLKIENITFILDDNSTYEYDLSLIKSKGKKSEGILFFKTYESNIILQNLEGVNIKQVKISFFVDRYVFEVGFINILKSKLREFMQILK